MESGKVKSKFKLENLKQIIKREDYSGNTKLQAIFDFFDTDKIKDGLISYKNKNGENEIQSIFKLDENEDGIIDEAEAARFVTKNFSGLKITSDDIFAFLNTLIEPQSTEQKPKSQSNTKLTESEVQEGVIQSLRADTDETISILWSQNNGAISNIYDYLKEMFNSDSSSAKVMEAAVNQNRAAKYMEKAQEKTLTRGEYIRENRERLKEMLEARLYKKDKNGVDYIEKHRAELKMSYSDFEKLMLSTIEHMTNDMNIENIKKEMRQLPLSTDAGDAYIMDNIKKNAVVLYGQSQQSGCSSIELSLKYISNYKKIVSQSPDDDKPMTFEEVFYYEQGVNYSKEACEEYLNNKNELTMKLSAYNKSLQFETEKDKILKEKDIEKAFKQLMDLFKNFYSTIDDDSNKLAYEQLCSIVEEKGIPVRISLDESGLMHCSMATGSNDILLGYIKDILSEESERQQSRLENIFGGDVQEKLPELQTKMEISHEKAYGNDFSSALGKKMVEDNKTFIQRYSGGTSMIGMGLIAVGGVLVLTPAAPLGAGMVTLGQGLAVTGLVSESALGFTEAFTRENGAEDGEYRELAKNLIFNAGGFVIGCSAGKMGMKAFNRLIDKKLANVFKMEITKGNRIEALKQVFTNPEYLKSFLKAGGIKISTDFLISYAGDLAMMGVLDTNDDWMSLLKANLMGVMVGLGSEVKGISSLGKKGDVYRSLLKKEEAGTLTKSEAEALQKLKQDPDIRSAYPELKKSKVYYEPETQIKLLTQEMEEKAASYVDRIMQDMSFITKNSYSRADMEEKGYQKSYCGYDGSDFHAFELEGCSCLIRMNGDSPAIIKITTPDHQSIFYKFDNNGQKVRVSEYEYVKIESKITHKSFTKDVEAFQESIENKCSAAELLEKLKKNNINFEFLADGIIIYEDSRYMYRYTIRLGSDGSVFGHTKTEGNDIKYYIYDSEGKSIEVTEKDFREKYNSAHMKKSKGIYYEKGYNKFKFYKCLFESDADTRLANSIIKYDSNNTIPRFNDLSFNIVKNLLRTDEDYKIFEYLISKKTTIKREYEYNSSDIINILESPSAKQFILDKINSGKSFKRSDINEKCGSKVINDVYTTRMHETRTIPEKIEDITLNDSNGKPLDEKGIELMFKQNPELKLKIPAGEVANINGKLYCNDGETLIQLDISKERFEKLFPPSERFKIKQGTIGDCYNITALSGLMDTPKGRARLFSLFHQDGNDIIIRFPEDGQDLRFINGELNKLAPVSITKKEGKTSIGFGSDQVSACQGIKLLEQAYSIHRYDGYDNPDAKEQVVNDVFFMNKKMHRLDGGHSDETVEDLIGSDMCSTFYACYSPEIITRVLSNPNAMIYFSTEVNFSGVSKYNLYNQHAYRIASYDEKTGMVGIVNPWNCDKITNIPVYELFNYIRSMKVVEIK